MTKSEQNEMERLRLQRFTNLRVKERLEKLEEKWQRWEECRIKI
jgi:hypothetical protein